MRKILAVLLAAALVPAGISAAAQKKKAPAKKTTSSAKKSTAKKSTSTKKPSSTAKRSTSAKKTTASAKKSTSSSKKKTTSSRRSSSSRSRRTSASSGQSWRSRQLAPAEDRYREIQQALISKGYLEGEATGKWGSDSVAALRHFQEDQSLEPSGKINSLSLIALGLGPKYDTAAVTAAPPAVPAP